MVLRGLLASVLLMAVPPLTLKAAESNPDPAASTAVAITVQILGPVPSSGTLVKQDDDRYTVLTAWHGLASVRPGEELQVQTADGQLHGLIEPPRRLEPGVDLGVLVFRSRQPYRLARLAAVGLAAPGQAVFVAGFPLATATIAMRTFRLREGRIEGVLPPQAAQQGYRLLYNVIGSTLPGMSGGPVVRADGLVVGIHGRAEVSASPTAQEDVWIKSGTSLAIPFDGRLAERLALRLVTEVPTPGAQPAEQVRERVVIREQVLIREPQREPGDLGAPCISYLYSGPFGIPSRCQREVEMLNRLR